MQRDDDRGAADREEFVVQPHNIQAEMAILGAVLVNNRAYWECAGLIGAEHFFEPVHARIWQACADAIDAGRLADPITLKLLFETDEALRELDGAAYLVRLAHAAETVITAAEYARVVARLAKRRAIMATAEAAAAAVARGDYQGDPEPLRKARAAIDAMLAGDDTAKADMASIAEEIIKEATNGSAGFISTGFAPLDQAMGGGFRAGKLYAVNALSKRFKTGLLLSCAANIGLAGIPVAWIALELTREEVGQRLLATAGQFDPGVFKHMTDSGVADVVMAAKKLLSVKVYHAPSATLDELQSKCERIVQENNSEILFIDYWQKLSGAPRGERETYLAAAADWMASFAERTKKVIVTASQMNPKTGAPYYGEGLKKAASWHYTIHKAASPQIDPNIPGGVADRLWLTGDVARDGRIVPIGSEDFPAFLIHPYGPRLVLADALAPML